MKVYMYYLADKSIIESMKQRSLIDSPYVQLSDILDTYLYGYTTKKKLAKEFEPVRDKNIVIEAKDKLAGKFASENHAGPKDVADFMDLEDEESIEMTKRDAYEQVQALLNLI